MIEEGNNAEVRRPVTVGALLRRLVVVRRCTDRARTIMTESALCRRAVEHTVEVTLLALDDLMCAGQRERCRVVIEAEIGLDRRRWL